MSHIIQPQFNRREFLKSTGQFAAVGALAGVALPHVHAAGSDQISVALIGCGGRGTGAAGNAMGQTGAPKLVAMADVFEHRLSGSHSTLKKKYGSQVDVSDNHKFISFDGYKGAIDCLKKGDVAIFTTPLAFRAVHFAYAIQKGVNVFMEKPVTADGPKSRQMLKLNEEAVKKGLKVGVGLNSRHSRALQELHQRVQDGEIGDVMLMRGYRMQPPIGSAFSEKYPGPDNDLPGKPSELMWQISRFHSFLWASGGAFSDFYIHHIDHLSWMKNAWPIKAQALGGRHYRGNYVDQNFDSYAVEYTFEDGAKLYMDGRCMIGAHSIYSSYVHGTKGMAIAAKSGDTGLPSSTYRGQNPDRSKMIWTSNVRPGEVESHFNEWTDLIDAIQNDKPFNEVERGVKASVVTNMGRFAAHTAQEVTFDEMLNHEHEYCPNADKLTMNSPAPVQADKDGKYPVPEPGIKKNREF
ncbi:MAG: Gfo/Idh/MocA family oxidoreductase [Verrucomicrobia bacterium]|nr:Gfo/Idh/MocA family oxidoreductase [Verrucomicrobiota bacterium]